MGSMRSVLGAWFGLSALLSLVVLAMPALVFADTATPPPTSQDSTNLLLAVIALGALSAVVVLSRPRRGKQ